MKEFASICHLTICSDLTLMEGFYSRLDDEIHLVMPLENYCWILRDYINFTLWIDESSFMVGDVEKDSTVSVQPHVTSVTTPDPEPTLTAD